MILANSGLINVVPASRYTTKYKTMKVHSHRNSTHVYLLIVKLVIIYFLYLYIW